MSQEIKNLHTQFEAAVKQNTGTTISAGVVVLLMGLIAMGSPLIVGLSVAIIVGVALVIGGMGQLAFALKTGKGVVAIIAGLLTASIGASIGAYMVINPDTVMASLTILLAIYLIISGGFEAFMAHRIKPARGWKWGFYGGIASIVLGVLLWTLFPLLGAWVIGLLLGIKLFLSGLALIVFGFSARVMPKDPGAAV